MSEFRKPDMVPEFDTAEGLTLALSYLEDPSNVPCPRCGPDMVEMVCYLDARGMEKGKIVPIAPDDDYTVVLYCRSCERAIAIDLSREDGNEEV